MGMKSCRFIIRGKVQGVWYRRSVEQNARAKGFSGYVRNLSDGSVEAAVTCEEAMIGAFVSLLREGSPSSRVESIEQHATDEVFTGVFAVR